MSQRFIEEVLQKAKQSDIAFVGIGTGSRYFEMTNLYLKKEQCMETEMKDKVKGDLIYNFMIFRDGCWTVRGTVKI